MGDRVKTFLKKTMKLLGSLLVAGALGASVKRSASPKSGRGHSGSPKSGSPKSGIASGSPKAPMDSPMKSGSPEWDFKIPEELMADKEMMEKMMKKFMMVKKMMKELKMDGSGVFAPVKNDIETEIDLEQNFITNINIDFDEDDEPRRPRSPHHKGPKSPKSPEHDSRSPDHQAGKMDLDEFFRHLEELDGDFPALLVNIQNFINQNNVMDTDVNMEILNGTTSTLSVQKSRKSSLSTAGKSGTEQPTTKAALLSTARKLSSSLSTSWTSMAISSPRFSSTFRTSSTKTTSWTPT